MTAPTNTTVFAKTPFYRIIRAACGVYILLALVIYAVAAPSRFTFLTGTLGQTLAFLQTLEEYALVVVAAVVGVFLYFKSARDHMVLMTAIVLVLSIANVFGLASYAPFTHPIFWIPSALVFFGGVVPLYYWYFMLPNGRTVPMWARWWSLLLIAWEMFRYFFFFVFVGTGEIGVRPLAIGITAVLQMPAFLSMSYYFRSHAPAIQRQQFKWIGVSFVLTPVSAVMLILRGIVRFQSDLTVIVATEVLAGIIITASAIFFCLAVAFAVLRYRLWEVDLTLNRSLVLGSVTFILLLLFSAIFVVAQIILRTVLGESGGELAVAISAVVVGVSFNPVRHRVRHVIDRYVFNLRFDLSQLERAQQQTRVHNAGVLTGRVIDGYELLNLVGRGGMGEVYKAKMTNGGFAAVKILRDLFIHDEKLRTRFAREGAVNLHHPNIIETLGYGERDGIYYIAFQFVEGKTLWNVLKERKTLPLDEVQDFLPDFASALDAAHAEGYVHRDITPSNVMMRLKPDLETYEALLMDFGIAKLIGATSVTGSGAVGTIDYMAPEQIVKAQSVDHRADIYALGIVLYETLVGTKPYDGSPGEVLFAHIQQPIPNPCDANPDLPPHVGKTLMKALAKNPDDRFQNASELTQALLS
jgi:hypothetical protein